MLEANESEVLSAYLDGETNSEELNRVNAMLATSSEWRQELERLTATKHTLATSARISCPPDLVASLLSHPAIAERRAAASGGVFSFRRWMWAGSGLAAAAALWLVVATPWVKPLPLSPLLAAHEACQSGPDIHSTLMAASGYSTQVAAQYADAR